MRNVLILFACLLASTAAFSQVDLKINPIGTLFGSPDLSVEISPAAKFGIEGAVGLNFGNLGIEELEFKRRGYTGFVAGKYYFNEEKGMDNLSIGLYVKGKHLDFTAKAEGQEDENFNRNKVAAGFIVGQKWVSDNNLIFELDLGIGRNFVSNFTYEDEENSSVNTTSIPFLNIDGIFRIAVGYRF